MRKKACIAPSLALLAGVLLPVDAFAGFAGSLPVSKGVYRIPYANGTTVHFHNDHTNHPNVLNRIDMGGISGGPYTIVAAGDGWVRFLVDTNTQSQCTGQPGCANNYVWIEHPNGEWTKYSHFKTGSVTALGRFVGEFVTSGTPLGTEGDIGFATGPHLHFEVAVPNDPGNPFDGSGFLFDDGDASTTNYDRQNRIAVFCDVGFALNGNQVEADDCKAACDSDELVGAGVADNQIRHVQADQEVETINNVPHIVAAGGGEALRAGQRVTLAPGFRAVVGSYFSASIGACDDPGKD